MVLGKLRLNEKLDKGVETRNAHKPSGTKMHFCLC